MTKSKQTIKLKSPASRRVVKSLALFAFSTLRGTVSSASKLPGFISDAASDIRDAWRETASQKHKEEQSC